MAVKLLDSKITKTEFKNSSFKKVDFSQSTLSHVVFENSDFDETIFNKSKLHDVRFVNCRFRNHSNFLALQSSDVVFSDSTFEKSSFSRAQVLARFLQAKLDDVRMIDLQAPSSLIFEKSNLIEVNVDRSVLSLFRAVESKVDATFESAKIDVVEFSNGEIDAGLDDSTLGTLTVHNSTISTLRMNTAHIDKVVITKCTKTRNFGFFESTIREMEIAQSSLNELDLADVSLDLLTIRDTLLFNSDLKRLRAKNLVLENVSLDKKIDFTGAQIGSIKAKNVSKLPSLHLITTGSNVQLD